MTHEGARGGSDDVVVAEASSAVEPGELASIFVRVLVAAGKTVAVAESLTGGALSARIVDVPGASAVLNGAVVSYATPVKASLLGVDPALLAAEGPVHPEVARQMAAGARRVVSVDGVSADVGIATTGVAGPDPQGDSPVGLIYIGLADDERSEAVEVRLIGDRAAIRAATVDRALSEATRFVRSAGRVP